MNAERSPKSITTPDSASGDVVAVLHYPRFDIDKARGELRVAGRPVALRPKTFALLQHLARHPGRLLGRNELIEAVWRDVIVTDDSLVQCISELRAALDDRSQKLIRTVPRRGYIFDVRPIGSISGESLDLTAPSQSQAFDEEDCVPESVHEGTPEQAPCDFVDVAGKRRAASNTGEAGEELTSLARSTRATNNLPVQMPPLYGRAEDVAALARLLEVSRVVSVVGPAGIGKTRLAQAVAYELRNDYADGVWIVELASLADGLLLVPTVARVLGHQIALSEGGLTSLVQLIRDQSLLLLLDNCEHLLQQAAHLVTQIVADAPGVRVLVTSQEPLHIDQEQIFRLDALAVPANADATAAPGFGAVQLFVARIQAADPKFTVDSGNVSDVVEICRRLDGIPLAIEFAAAREPLLGVHGLLRRLDESLRLLAGGNRTAPARHQTLRGALQWSYGLLSAPEQTVFDRLGVFMGTFSLEAAQCVASDQTTDSWAVIDHLASLVDKSLVMVERGEVPRYRLLESSRAFALERLAITGSLDATRRRHAEALAQILTGDDLFEEPLARMRRIAPDLDNVRAAVAWALGPTGDHQIAVELAAATDRLWDARGFNDEGARLYRTIEPWVDESTPPRLAARFWFAVADLRMRTELKREAASALRAARLFQGLNDRFGAFRSLTVAAHQFAFLADRDAAIAALTGAEALLDDAWPSWLQTSVAYCRVVFAYFIDRKPDEARRLANAALQGLRLDHSFYGNRCEIMLPACDLLEGDFASALRRCNDILNRSSVTESVQLRSHILSLRGAALVYLDDFKAAELALRSACTLSMHARDPMACPYCHVALLLARQGRLVDAARTLAWIDNRQLQAVRDWIPPMAVSSYKEARAIVDSAFTREECDRLASEGARLSFEQVTAMAFPVVQSGVAR
ncbi:winged helix-turn-helix domain-containing protein [Paraburkholderia sp. HP33-1]|uniref:winged helix-turn-helix domain-containing protein n=1 Tax=Paraburkholderia sp. HP33-1 TaxID=2883243 RepID=UPI001F3DA91D|nr:winged helix-turn-helix domain-containing protein [Paraburkholderia sp. HP33-1]